MGFTLSGQRRVAVRVMVPAPAVVIFTVRVPVSLVFMALSQERGGVKTAEAAPAADCTVWE